VSSFSLFSFFKQLLQPGGISFSFFRAIAELNFADEDSLSADGYDIEPRQIALHAAVD